MTVTRRRFACAAPVLAALALARPLGAQVIEVPTFPVATATFSDHLQDVDVAAGADGSFVVIWGAYSFRIFNGSADHAGARQFSGQGVPLGPPRQVDTSAHVYNPTISADGQGGYAAAWNWIGNNYLFFGQLLDATGAPRGSDFEVTLNLAGYPIIGGSVLGRPSGPVFLWGENGLWLRALDANRDRVGGDIRVGSGGYRTAIAPLADGGFVTAWRGGSGEEPAMARLFGPNAQPRTDAFAVGVPPGMAQVAGNPLGGFAVAGTRVEVEEGTSNVWRADVWVRRFDDDGQPIDGEGFLVHPGLPNAYVNVDLEFDALGNLHVVWTQFKEGNFQPVRARAFDVDGNPLGPAIEITDKPGADVRTALLTNGAFVNVWYLSGQAWGAIVRLCPAGAAVCGDGVRVAACEHCDDGAANSDSIPDACRTDCRRPHCGDGVQDAGEECDDGNTLGCDGCSARCRLEPGAVCGDGVRARACGEECDDGAANSDTVPGACRTDCRLARCGDGVRDAGEACDDGNGTSCDGCGFDCTDEVHLPDENGNGIPDACDACRPFAGGAPVCTPRPLPGLTSAQFTRFAEGRDEFLETEHPATGLGPVFNGTRCAECHNHPTTGGSSTRFVTRIGTRVPNVHGQLRFDPLLAQGGPLLQERGITTDTCTVEGEVVPPEATIVARRDTPPLFGLGLLEAVPDLAIRLFEDATDRNNDGISGRFNTAPNGLIGRFGWKAQVSSLFDFAAEAYLEEMGITSPLASTELLPQGEPSACDDEPDPEDDGSDVAAFAEFMALLAPPPTSPVLSKPERRGRRVFRKLKCHLCHTDKYRTPSNFPIRALRGLRVLAYTDLLLHDMGPELADGVTQRWASGSEFRTAPLWGVRNSAPYLHDGRAATLEEAILAHGGEARASRDAFAALPPDAVANLVAFLKSL